MDGSDRGIRGNCDQGWETLVETFNFYAWLITNSHQEGTKHLNTRIVQFFYALPRYQKKIEVMLKNEKMR